MVIATVALALALLQGPDTLGIKDLKVGEGEVAKVGDYLTVDYTGTLADGKVFDSSVGKDPFKFILGAGMVIKGWDRGMEGMKVGGKRLLTIPPSLGYGDKETGPIPGKSTLTFEVTLQKIERVETKILTKGKGEGAKAGDTVDLHYKGTFTDGKQFDSSYDRGKTFPIVVGQTRLIPGFTMGVLGMKAGEKRRVTIPYALAYGEKGRSSIPPKSDLIFEIEVLSIKPAQP